MLDGPGPGIYANYSAVVLVCGGSGIIFAIALVLELLQGRLDGTNYVEAIELVWIVQDPGKTSQKPRFETKVDFPRLRMFGVHISQACINYSTTRHPRQYPRLLQQTTATPQKDCTG